MPFLQKLFGPPNIKRLSARRNIKGLLKALGYKASFVRVAAVRAVEKLKDARAVEPLITTLKKHPEMWKAIAVALKSLVPFTDAGRCAEVQALVHEAEVLAKIADLKSGQRPSVNSPSIFRGPRLLELAASAELLGELGDLRAIEPLIAVLRDESKMLIETAAEALGKLGDPRAIDSLIAAADKILSEAKFDVASRTGPDGEIYERHPFEDGPLKALERIGRPKAMQAVEELRQKRRELQKRASK